ncbi:purine-nucleoside phosphorylase [bacterium (Candidatus Blackallbacteria) CG17_big_fil_post_rev_8_21_14_2_50_48_46]|uniref:Purine nucleoside phosphorylase n=1 Tax=bacterium (Candidatus Blackallbacteria) CG17_big_fil_post_rev_8_21_14_2_50_48_46 TaxID=2014261 RepID=A0A2M7GBF5_9BACT|nr:MAG: purine-nucleoside phosphorylase [bacterium (Candidatus Blackallbacteria) CG18_big_fil_WC_8_21_14_2_50_49_26]PIW19516.1 MAG: purine-nucleoside phosphorylase [bacterium (Candidatus Blackallbacteria) CG17_big_fil_post_rev_8_21_14_2_50_48_46]PIW48880.1 MAG: purine-nucleoside phosphorylase [bacterium (Candidatus Blackallbacteria) CG13_big_fil_rev_8_21_14_2_50_49_14]
MNNQQEQLAKIAAQILEQASVKPDYGIILGSGLGILAESAENATVIPYSEIPHFPTSTAPGHAGNLVVGKLGGKNVVMMQGRFHTYEGYTQQEVTLPIAVMKEMGVHSLIVTCATGGLNYNFVPGDIMLIRDHINFTGSNPLIGPNDEELGPRFPVMFDAYTPALRAIAHEAALKQGIRLHEGVYCGITGPAFFTAAELRMLMQWGCDSIGMSTVPEVIMAVHRGLKVMGLALISDMAIPDTGHHATGEEVLRVVNESSPKFAKLLVSILQDLA